MMHVIRKGHNVKRWHTTHRLQEETVGHHSAGVASVVWALNPECRKEVLVAALLHDVEEGYTGDLPYMVKRDHQHLKDSLARVEEGYLEAQGIPYPELTQDEVNLLKFADMAELILSAVEDWGRGNQYARNVVNEGAAAISRMRETGVTKLEWIQQLHNWVEEAKQECQLMTNK